MVQRKLQEAAAQHEEAQQQAQQAQQQRAGLEERLAAAKSSLAESRQQEQQAQQAQQDAARSANNLRQQLAEAQQQVAAAEGERLEWATQRSELQQELTTVRKAQAAAEGKLAVAKQREAQFKVRESLRGACIEPQPHCSRFGEACSQGGVKSCLLVRIVNHTVGWCSSSIISLATAAVCPCSQSQEASKQLKVLQKELGSFLEEGAANQQKREAAEQR